MDVCVLYINILVSYASMYVELCSLMLKFCNNVSRHYLFLEYLAL
jgi:hypothetical protein